MLANLRGDRMRDGIREEQNSSSHGPTACPAAKVTGHEDESGRAETQNRVQLQIRNAVWRMENSDDVVHVVESLQDGLRELRIDYDVCAINVVVSEDPPRVSYYEMLADGDEVTVGTIGNDGIILRMWRRGEPTYRRDLDREDPDHEQATIRQVTSPARSVLDVPFGFGTLAVNSARPDAFSPRDISHLQAVADVLTEAFGRWQDLRQLEQQNRELAETGRLLSGIHGIIGKVLHSLDLEEILDRVSEEILTAGLFRSLMVAIVDRDAGTVQVVRDVLAVEGPPEDGRIVDPLTGARNITVVSRAQLRGTGTVGPTYAVDDASMTAQVAHSGEVAVVEAEDDDSDLSFFIPILHGGQAQAVLTTGSGADARQEMLRRIEAMRPLFDQVAAALQHAQLYQTARHEIERRTRAEREQTISLCVQRVRNQSLQMEFEQDWGNVLTALRGELDGLMDYLGGGLTLIDREAETYQSCNILPDGSVKLVDHDSLPASLKQALDLQVPVYRHNRAEMDALGEDINPQAHSVIDVPFRGGTLTVSAIGEDAFDEQDIHILSQFAQVMSEGHQRLEEIARSQRQARLRDAVAGVREQVWGMEVERDLVKVMKSLGEGLRAAGLQFTDCGLNLVTPFEGLPMVRFYAAEQEAWIAGGSEHGADVVRQIWSSGTVAYRRDLQREDLYGEAGQIEHSLGHAVRSVVDVPFPHGTLAVNSTLPDAFDAEDLEIIEAMTQVLSEGVTRMGDLQALQQRNRALEEEVQARRQTEEALVVSESRYRSLFDSMENGCALHEMVLDDAGEPVDYVFLEVNDAFERHTTLRRQDLIGRRATAALPGIERDPADWIGTYGAVVRTGKSTAFENYSDVLGKWFSVIAYRPADGQFAVVFTDITDRKRMEQELVASHRLRAMGELSAGVSHNLNNILTGVLAPVQFLQMITDDAEILELAAEIETSGKRATEIVQRLNRAVRQGPEKKLVGIQLNECIVEAIEMTRPRWKDEAEARGCQIRVFYRIWRHRTHSGQFGGAERSAEQSVVQRRGCHAPGRTDHLPHAARRGLHDS